MNDKARAARREYQRAWRAAHKEKVSEYNRTYWERRAQQVQAKSAQESGRTGENNE